MLLYTSFKSSVTDSCFVGLKLLMRRCYVIIPWYKAAQKLICYFDLESWISKWCPSSTQYDQDVDVVPEFLLYMAVRCVKCRI